MRRRDGQARALFRLLTKPILASLKNADVVPVEGETGGTEEAEFAKNLLFLPANAGGMTHTFNRFVQQMLLALFTGFSGWEMVYWVPRTGPNEGKVCLRKMDWRPSETLTFLTDGQGEFCFTYDVEVSQLDGTEVPIGEMAERHARGEEQWVYSCTRDGRVVPGRVTNAWKTSDSASLVEVELDNGEKVKCTPAHPWMMRDGTYRRAAELRPGDSLMPLYRRERQVSLTSQKYEQVWHPRGRWEFTHRMVSRNLGFGAGRGQLIHHWFGGLGHRNNDPRNLERMTRQAHIELHARLADGAIERSRQVTPADVWGNHSPVTFTDIDQAARAIVSAGKRLTWQAVTEKLGCSQDVIYDRLLAAGHESWKSYKWSLDQADWQKDRKYHRRKELRAAGVADGRVAQGSFADVDREARRLRDEGCLPTWRDVAVALGCSQDVLYARLRDAGYAGWKDYRASLTHNHKVVAVRSCAPEPVYDIEVEEHHNFALTAGVFVHNSGFRQRTFFQGRTIDVKIPRETALYFAHDEAERPFYGVSMFESAFYHYDKKEKLYYIAHLAAQRAAVGTRVGTMPPNAAPKDKDNFLRALSQLGLAQYMALPSADWTVELLNETSSRFDFLGLINHHNSQMSKSVLAQWFDSESGAGAGQGDSTLVDFGKQNDTTFMMMLEGILEEMAEVINNHIFPRFIDWNFGTEKYPRFKWGALTAEQKAAIQDTFDKLAVAGQQANVTPEFMLELEQHMADDLGFNIDYDKIKKDREKQQKLMAQQAQQPGMGGPPGMGGGAPQPGQPPVMAGNTAGSSAGPPGMGGGAPQQGPPQPQQQGT
jgi:Intein splicing domain/Protein of unknown function (DUF935)